MVDATYSARDSILLGLGVFWACIVTPRAFCELVEYLDVLLGDFVSFVMCDLAFQSQIPSSGVEKRGHYVPCHPPIC